MAWVPPTFLRCGVPVPPAADKLHWIDAVPALHTAAYLYLETATLDWFAQGKFNRATNG